MGTAIACDDSGNETVETREQQFTVHDEIDPVVTSTVPDYVQHGLAADCTDRYGAGSRR